MTFFPGPVSWQQEGEWGPQLLPSSEPSGAGGVACVGKAAWRRRCPRAGPGVGSHAGLHGKRNHSSPLCWGVVSGGGEPRGAVDGPTSLEAVHGQAQAPALPLPVPTLSWSWIPACLPGGHEDSLCHSPASAPSQETLATPTPPSPASSSCTGPCPVLCQLVPACPALHS